MTTDPLAHLAAALDAAQRDAEAARDAHRGVYATMGDAEWYYDPTDGIFTKPHGIQVTPGVPYVDPDAEPHLARHDPASVLRRIAADRKMLDLHQTSGRIYEYAGAPPREATICRVCRYQEPMSEDPCATVRLLAEAWGWTEEET